MKNKSPKSIPVSRADVEKAKRDATQFATRACYAIFLTVMRDKEGYSVEDLQRLFDRINYLADSVKRKYVTIPELIQNLAEEDGIEVN